ncbi:bone morphogenetic protein 2-like [Ornithodoros turicata]|uniref:bone morphogenetic protein 2-like n=1 Tax=Ornithodoros turicata TaxID=34597 RepID=UPI003138CBE7
MLSFFLLCAAVLVGTAGAGPLLASQDDLDSEVLDGEVVEVIKQRILADLGLMHIPDVSRANVSAEHMDRMLRVYRRSVEASREEDDEDAGEDGSVHRFYSFTNSAPLFPLDSRGDQDRHHLHFPVHIPSSSGNTTQGGPRGITVRSAKLRLHHSSPWTATVLVYQLLEPSTCHRHPNCDKLLIAASDVSAEGWHLFDVSRAVGTWVERPHTNYGLLVECRGSCRVSPDTSLDVEVVENVARVRRHSVDTGVSSLDGHPRLRMECSNGMKTKVCCRYALKVSFAEIGWDWIVEPKEFEAYFCKGKCPNRYRNFASTHALLQSIINKKSEGREVPRPCCAPRKLKPLSLLHYNNDDPPTLSVTRQKGMIVKECACS